MISFYLNRPLKQKKLQRIIDHYAKIPETIIIYTNGTSEEKLIEGKLTWQSIGKIGEQSIDTTIKSVKIGTAVTSIGAYAFYYCTSLQTISIPDSVTTIGDLAFYCCSSLSSITIPASVTSIGDTAFGYCPSVESIYVNSGNTVYDSRNCNAIIETETNTLISGCKNTIIPDSIITINARAFRGCSFKSITIPNSVTSIGIGAFAGCTLLEQVIIGNSVTSIGNIAFQSCYVLTTIIIQSTVLTYVGSNAFADINNSNSYIYVPNETIKQVCLGKGEIANNNRIIVQS